MKKLISILALAVLITGCNKTSSLKSLFDEYFLGKQEVVRAKITNFNIVLFVDGTDRIHNEYAVPSVDVNFISSLARKIQQHGLGNLWVSYIDESSQNNRIANLEILQAPVPIKMAGKKRSETKDKFKKREKTESDQFKKDSVEFEKGSSKRLAIFLKEAQNIIQTAYSDKVATAKAGSDINGAINTGNRLLKTIPDDSDTKLFIALVSDGVDNIGKTLNEVPENVKLLLINNSGSKNHLDTKMVELDNLIHMEEFVFSDKDGSISNK